jgi:hypothetical protein
MSEKPPFRIGDGSHQDRLRGSGRQTFLSQHLFQRTADRSEPDSRCDLAGWKPGEPQRRLRKSRRRHSVLPLHADGHGKWEPGDAAAHYRSSPS